MKIIPSTQAQSDYIENQLIAYNNGQVNFTQQEPFIKLNHVALNDDNEVIGGINATLYCWKILYIDILWVDERYRAHGYGAALLQHVEHKAREQGCRLVHLDTFDFQAKDFYLQQGYEVFGVLDDCPLGHQRFYLKKRL